MLEEQLAIIEGLLDGSGRLLVPRPLPLGRGRPVPGQPTRRINVLVGGNGTPRSMRIAAAHAGEFNLSSSSPELALERFGQLDAACRAAGRDPATLVRSAMVGCLIGRNHAQVERRIDALVKLLAGDSDDGPDEAGSDAWLAERRTRWIIGTPEQARARIRQYANAGCERIMLQDFLPWDLEMIDLMGAEIVRRA